MSFGFSPSDVLKLVEVSTRVYLAFKDANENSEAQVDGLVREFTTFHHCLVELEELMREYGKPLPFPFDDFQNTLQRCEKSIKPYAENLVDKKMNFTKMVYTVKYMGKEKEIDGLRKQITGHYQALQMCISFLQLRLHLEATKQTQRLLATAPFRSMSLGGQWYTSNALPSASRTDQRALPAADGADGLYRDWQVFNRWLKSEDDRISQEAGLTRPLSLGDTPAAAPSGDAQIAAVLYHLRRELEDAIVIEENRAKRTAVERRTHLGPSDAVRQELRDLPRVPQRTFTLDTEFSGLFSRFDEHHDMSDSMATIRPNDTTLSPNSSPRLEQGYFSGVGVDRAHSVSSIGSGISASPVWEGSGRTTVETTPELVSSQAVRNRFSTTSLATLALGETALEWKRLCHKVQVERTITSGQPESRECDLHWKHNEDTGIAIRSVYRSSGVSKVWTTQSFPATGPSIPLSTSYPDGDTSIDFPQSSYGRLDKKCTDIKYTFPRQEATQKIQALLYTNNGKDAAELLFDRCVLTVSSNLNKPECRGKNVRLWRKSERHDGEMVDVLVLLFYTSALPEGRAHWVEEPHHVFQWLTPETCGKTTEKLPLVFSKEPGKWCKDKLFQRRSSSSASVETAISAVATPRRDSGQSVRSPPRSPRTPSLVRPGTQAPGTSAISIGTSHSFSSRSVAGGVGNLNRFGYDELEIKFLSKSDRKDFVAIWQQYVNKLGSSSSSSSSRA